VRGADSAGDLFTPEELLAALQRIYSDAEARQLAADWTDDGIAPPGKGWSENVLVLIAATVCDRAERIRRHLGFSPERMASELQDIRAQLQPLDDTAH
jgi:hypothetical protein